MSKTVRSLLPSVKKAMERNPGLVEYGNFRDFLLGESGVCLHCKGVVWEAGAGAARRGLRNSVIWWIHCVDVSIRTEEEGT